MLTAVLLATMMMATAAAVDIGKAVYVRSNLQKAVDAAAKAAAADSLGERGFVSNEGIAARVERTAKAYIAANALSPSSSSSGLVNYNLNDSSNFTTVYTPGNLDNPNADNEDTVSVTLRGSVPVTFYRMFASAIPVAVTSTVKRPRPAPVELVIALDTTNSMGQRLTPSATESKLSALKNASKDLVDILMTWDSVKIGLVPFAGPIRLKASTSSYFDAETQTSRASWLSFPETNARERTVTIGTCRRCLGWTETNCRTETVSTMCESDGVQVPCTGIGTICDGGCTGGWREESCEIVRGGVSERWRGCMFLRRSPESTSIGNTVRKPYYGIWQNNGCGSAIIDLVSPTDSFMVNGIERRGKDWLKDQIDGLTVAAPAQRTYIPAALVWAWNMLTTETTTPGGTVIDDNFPLNSGFTAAQVSLRNVRKSLVLITDGEISAYPERVVGYDIDAIRPIEGSSNPAGNKLLAEAEMTSLCANIKASNITIYVIALQFDPQNTYYQKLRDNCASGTAANRSSFFFVVTNYEQLRAAFRRIGNAQSYTTVLN